MAEAVRLLRQHGVKRLPVTNPGGRLVGIVNRSDLLGVFLRPDEEIRQEILEEVIFSRFGLAPDRFQVTVSDGVVELGRTLCAAQPDPGPNQGAGGRRGGR